MAIPTNRDSDKFVIRLPEGMRDRIKAAADQNNRSMNAEIVATLGEAYPDPAPFDWYSFAFEEWTNCGRKLPEVERLAFEARINDRLSEEKAPVRISLSEKDGLTFRPITKD
ncbi:Arc-like DNA binding dprotein [Rhodobacter sp. JA431]|uniref:Arc family DNA-binding protein n=1 Tax=Rhodobacter sp. JA431 TaxID=570013 RepID=UPI000BD5BC16|nr:Arc family DNA-binding protein [Rhodobacter sp. JA431]SOC11227.1 Arc-like DNA binding dprotein [Rhodobacter sp. JA431]